MFKKLYTLIGALGAISTGFYPGFAYSTCQYENTTNNHYSHKINSIKNIQSKTISYVEDTRKCTVTMDVSIDNKWYKAEGSYVFGSYLSEDAGCQHALDRAKEDVLSLVSPETVTGSKNLRCSTGFDYVRSVDLVSERVDNKVCKKVYFDARIRNTLGKVWGYSCQ